MPATRSKKNFWHPTRESGSNLIRRKLFSLETLAEGPGRVRSATFHRAASILFWHENANFAIIPDLHVSLVGFLKILFILNSWDHFKRLGSRIGNGCCHRHIDSETGGGQGICLFHVLGLSLIKITWWEHTALIEASILFIFFLAMFGELQAPLWISWINNSLKRYVWKLM